MMTSREQESYLRQQASLQEETLGFWFNKVDGLLAQLDSLDCPDEPCEAWQANALTCEELRDELGLATSKLNYELRQIPVIEKQIDAFLKQAGGE